MSTGYPSPGERLGPFEVGERLGVGGMGVVFKARDTHLNRDVALKIIAPHLSGDADFQARFVREARSQASLDSGHVVQVYSFGEEDGRFYIASQLVPDGDLGQMLQRHGVPPARIALDLIAQIADGLADAHARGLVHRDIKPGNVLLRKRSGTLQAYLADFGIARQVTDRSLTQAGGTVGTPSYMAPELHLGGDAGTSTDVYSLGCLLWATLSGTAPYTGGSGDFAIMRGHIEGEIPQLAPTGPLATEINRILRTALAKTAAERYPSAAAMRDDLNRVAKLPDDPVPVRVAGAAPSGPVATGPWQPPGVRAPTPTPTPTPAPRTPTPTPSATPSGPTAAYSRPQAAYAPPGAAGGTGARRSSTTPLVLGFVAVLAVAAIVVLVVLLTRGGDEPTVTGNFGSGGSSGTPTASSTDSGGSARDAAAVESLTAAFDSELGLGTDTARCIAQYMVDNIGVDKLVQSGALTSDLQVTDNDLNDPEIEGQLTSATFACVDLNDLGDLGG